MIKTLMAAAAAAALALPVQADTLAQWNFDTVAAASSSTSWTGIAPSAGSGSASGVHAVATAWSVPAGNGSARSISGNNWAVGDYWEFSFSTAGYSGLSLSWDQSSSNTGPASFSLAYSTDGSSFTTYASYSVINGSWSAGTPVATTSYSYNLSALSALDGAGTVYIRLVDAGTLAVNGSTVASTGTSRIDNFTAVATPVPEAGTGAMIAAGLAVLGFMARRRRAQPLR